MTAEHLDVLIVGAGLSGIGAGYHLQAQSPHRSYAILEARAELGGTWDLFRYPEIRSDSDMFTLGYSFRLWIADSYPAIFADFNDRIKNPHGFDRPLPARERKWVTPNGKANFISPRSLSEDPDLPLVREGVLTLITVRSNDQFNTRSTATTIACAASTIRAW